MIDFCIQYPINFTIAEEKNHTMDNSSIESQYYAIVAVISLLCIFTCVVCICGLLGNGAVIWLLGFRIKRNTITTYILNLAVADFGVLVASFSMAVINMIEMHLPHLYHLYYNLFTVDIVIIFFSFFFYSTSQFLLTMISIDRCVSVLFPLWYRCHRPGKLSMVLCGLIWLLTIMVHGICLSVHFSWISPGFHSLFFGILVIAVVCLLLTTISTLILFVKFCFKSQQRRRGKLLTAILLTLFFFLIFALPLDVIYLIYFSYWFSYEDWLNIHCNNAAVYGWLCASLNSFVNPLLYFLVGRKKKGLCRENLKLILRRVFIEEVEVQRREEPGTQLRNMQAPLPQENF